MSVDVAVNQALSCTVVRETRVAITEAYNLCLDDQCAGVTYEHNGYTLTRTPLPSGTAGVVAEAMDRLEDAIANGSGVALAFTKLKTALATGTRAGGDDATYNTKMGES